MCLLYVVVSSADIKYTSKTRALVNILFFRSLINYCLSLGAPLLGVFDYFVAEFVILC